MKHAFALIVLGGLLAAGATQDTPASAANARLYADAVGDVSCCTRDIGDVRVTNDDPGAISFAVTARDVPGDVGSVGDDDDLVIEIDADYDRSSGNDGVDYLLFADVAERQVEAVGLSVWRDGPRDFRPLPGRSLRSSATRNVFRLTLDRHVLADTERFRFRVALHEVTSIGGASSEFAPSAEGWWSYRVGIALARVRPSLTSTRAVAGGSLVARLALRVAGGRARLASGRISCRASVAGRRLAVLSSRFVARRAVCEWQIPRTARGELLRGRIGVYVTPSRSSFVGRTFRARILAGG